MKTFIGKLVGGVIFAALTVLWVVSRVDFADLIGRFARRFPAFRGSLPYQGQLFPPGHFYSPIPSIEEIKERERLIFREYPPSIPGIDLNVEEQLQFLQAFKGYYRELPFTDHKTPPLRFYFDNPSYSDSDAICLYCMIRHLKPQRIVEIGSGFSSAVMLDTNELFFSNRITCTFIDPYPDGLYALLKDSDCQRHEILERKGQDVDVATFDTLRNGDILFVDSTHVAKTGSDVNYLFSTVLPRLHSGVHIHFHDIFYGFEYPKEWVYEGRAWNEAYLLRAFLQYNTAFKIVFFNTFLEHFYRDQFSESLPLCLRRLGGSIWLRRI